MALADTIVARALETAGLSYGDPVTRQAYTRHLYPGDRTGDGGPSTAALQLASTQSSCLLHARALLAADEVDGFIPWPKEPLDVLRCSYAQPNAIGMVEAFLHGLAEARGVTLDAEARSRPEPADVLVIGFGGSLPADPAARAKHLWDFGGVAHGLVVTAVRREGSRVVVESVDGGQTDSRNGNRPTAIRPRSRELVRVRDAWWLADGTSARKLTWGMRASCLPYSAALGARFLAVFLGRCAAACISSPASAASIAASSFSVSGFSSSRCTVSVSAYFCGSRPRLAGSTATPVFRTWAM